MPTCSQCNKALTENARKCTVCGRSASVTDLKIDPGRIDREAVRVAAPRPGEWGRGIEADATPTGITLAGRREQPKSFPAPQRVAPSEGALALATALDEAPESDPEEHGEAEVLPIRQETAPAVEPAPAEAQVDPRVESGQNAEEMRDGSPARRPTPTGQSAVRPPILASEALRRELAPAQPGAASIRLSAVGLGALGAAASLAVSDGHGPGLALGGAMVALLLLGLTPMPYPARAGAIVTLAGAGLGLSSFHMLEAQAGGSRLALCLSVTVLSLSLLFRGWHRASLLARALVALGITLCAGWVWLSGALDSLTILETHWQAWLPPVLQIPFALLLLLSLLAFMDSRSTGACTTWAALLLTWHIAQTWSVLAIAYWPSHTGAPRVDDATVVGYLTAPLFTALLAIGLAQLLAVANSFERD